MDGKADHRQHGGDEERVDLADPPMQQCAHDREDAGQDEDVVQKGGERGTAELKAGAPSPRHVAKADGEQHQDGDRGHDDGER